MELSDLLDPSKPDLSLRTVFQPIVDLDTAARDLGDRGPEADRRFDYALTNDRELVLAVAQTLLERIAPT
ncbi:hypothetical protein BH23ACT2_BH23ACT2_06170 [soil metagenome]